LDGAARYTLTNLDVPGVNEADGRELMDAGLPVSIKDRPAAIVIAYKKSQ
jgi:hypothetical protein